MDHLCRLVLRDGWQMADRPPRPCNLPYDSIGTLFKGREQFLEDLRGRLRREGRRAAAIVSRQAIYGLGGVGKTRLAIEYAHRHRDEYSALLFVTADTPEALRRNLAGLCGAPVLNLPEQAAKEEDMRFAAVLCWLGEHSGWLLVFDSVDTREAAAQVEHLLARFHSGHVLVTSRLREWSGAIEALELDVLGEDDSVAFLLERTKEHRRPTPLDQADARTLAREFDGLALALEQAGAFISKLSNSLGECLQRWRSREKKVREWYDERLMQYPRSVAVTWDATFDQLDPAARALLRLLCWLAPEPIPRALLETEGARRALSAAVTEIQTPRERTGVDRSKIDPEDALAGLAGFSMLKWEVGNNAFRIHRLVKEITRERLPKEERESWLRAALGVVDDYLTGDPPPQDVRSWPVWEPMRAHVAVVIAAAEGAGIGHPTSRLMNDLGLLLKTKCVWDEAESLYRRALEIDEESFGKDHPNVARDLNNLASLLQATNRLAEAEPLMRRALQILLGFSKATSHEHPHLRAARTNYTGLLAEMGLSPEKVAAQLDALVRRFGIRPGG